MVNTVESHASDLLGGTEDEWTLQYLRLKPGEVRAPIFDQFAAKSAVPEPVAPELVWRNELGGQTWHFNDRYLKWSPYAAGVDLARETERLGWLGKRHPAPCLLDSGDDGAGQWMLTAAIDADTAVSEFWRANPELPVRAIAEGLRRLHAVSVAEVPKHWESWACRAPSELGPRPQVGEVVLVHGDACAPNTLIDAKGRFAATVDVGDLTVGDRWADLAVASMSLEWNYGPGWDATFHDAYGVEPDPARIAYFRALWAFAS